MPYFAIPIEIAIEKAEKIINGDNTIYPYLGVSMLNVSDLEKYSTYANYLNKEVNTGVLIVDVEKNSVADKAGLKSGDIIIKINDEDIENVAYLRYELYKYSVGDKITITYERNSKIDTTSLKLTASSGI